MNKKPVHVILPHYNGGADIIRALGSIQERTDYPTIITIIDDGSREDDIGKQFLRSLKPVKDKLNIIFNDTNVGVTKNLNKGFAMYPDLHCVRMDADAEIQSYKWLSECVEFMEAYNNVGVVGPIGLNTDWFTIQTAGQWLVISPDDMAKQPMEFAYEIFDKMGQPRTNIMSKEIEVDSVLGCCALLNRKVIDRLGGVDEGYFGWVEDNDFCIGARALGYKNFVLSHVSHCHHGHGPKRSKDETNKILKNSEDHFIKKWGFSLYEPTPYWNDIVKRYKGTEVLWRYNDTY